MALPTILLGSHAVFNDEIQATTAIYENSIRLPGEYCIPTTTEVSPQQFVEELKIQFSDSRHIPISRHGAKSIIIPSSKRLFTFEGLTTKSI